MTTKIILQKLSLIFLPSLLWILLTALGIGAQSLANLIELLVIFLLSVILAFIPEKTITFKYLIFFLLLVTILSRLLVPIIPE
ncbi:hypothetical protein [Otariodibacter oris]|uniref:Uncharacterized protein n=1 Tax=Otariodibacter oris TaxID=1032623 RepID=A0A420XFA1_9PAST|nr:hypothetical protein [Otariodibacter oris]QGM81356.1 hypothetical protein A6A10_08005 [Otariodibacter oris]RKR70832.1 hypothetical protein DES31_1842 [Otariodibacter oris]